MLFFVQCEELVWNLVQVEHIRKTILSENLGYKEDNEDTTAHDIRGSSSLPSSLLVRNSYICKIIIT